MKTYSFSDLTESQKQSIAEKWCSDVAQFTCQTHLVEYVIKQGWEDSEAPFCYDDITNNESYGSVKINGAWEELTGQERDEKLEFYEYLRDKASNALDLAREKLEGLADEDYDPYSDHVDAFEENCLDRYQEICDSLEHMDFDKQCEVVQWFQCSEYACRKLNEAGQCTLDDQFWGRQAYGQSIVLDYVVQRVAFEHYCDYKTSHISQNTMECNKWV